MFFVNKKKREILCGVFCYPGVWASDQVVDLRKYLKNQFSQAQFNKKLLSFALNYYDSRKYAA